MTLTELRYIVAVARERHFGRAAESCFVSQPTLSVGVRKLEDELGVQLFERGSNEVTVTPVGERIVSKAQHVLEETAALAQLAQSGKDQLSGRLRLGVIYTVGPYLLSHLIPVLRERAPKMPLLIEEQLTARLTERLKNGDLDAIVVSLPYREHGIETVALYDEPFVIVIPGSHEWNQRDRIPVADLSGENVFLLGAGHCFRDQVLAQCPDCGRAGAASDPDQSSLEGGSLETIRHMVASGTGITVLPCTAAGVDRFSQRLLAIRRFAPPVPSRRVALAWRKSFPRPDAIRALREAIMSCRLSCVTMLDGERYPEAGRDAAREA